MFIFIEVGMCGRALYRVWLSCVSSEFDPLNTRLLKLVSNEIDESCHAKFDRKRYMCLLRLKHKVVTVLAVLFIMNTMAFGAPDALEPGETLYLDNCAKCHEGGFPKAPHRDWLSKMAPDAVLHSLSSGIMQRAAESLSSKELVEITEFLTGVNPADYSLPPGPKACTGFANKFDQYSPPAAAGWGYDTRRFVTSESVGISKADVSRLALKWAMAFPGASRARSLPVVAMGAIFVGSQNGTVYALDLESGCARWSTRFSAEIRTGIVVEAWPDGELPTVPPRLFFGDLMGRVHALDALSGDVLWSVRADNHPNTTITGTPVFNKGRLYVPVSSLEVLTAPDPNYECCTFRGSVIALDPRNGDVIWQHYTVPEPAVVQGISKVGAAQKGPSGAAVWGSPAIDENRGVLYFGSSENYSSPADKNSDAIFAVDLETGKRLWRQQLLVGDAWNAGCYFGGVTHPNCPSELGPDFDFSASPLLVDLPKGKQLVVVGQKSGMVYALDPDRGGELKWSTRVGRGGVQGGVHFGMAADGAQVYVPIVDIPIDSAGLPIDGELFPGIHSLDARSGNIIWRSIADNKCAGRKNCDPGISAAVSAIPGVVFAGHLDGRLRAYDAVNGSVLWETNTDTEFEAVNGIAKGGSIGGPGPVIAGGALIVNSGYDFGDHMPGNALLVFTPGGK